MKMSITAPVIMVSALLVASEVVLVSAQPTCGEHAGGALCPSVRCCSIWGYCGDTGPYCGDTCQLDCWSGERPDHLCGPAVNNPPCGEGRCCSIHGWCGEGEEYCSGGNCQYRCQADLGLGHGSLARALVSCRNLTAASSIRGAVTESLFNDILGRGQKGCPTRGFYTYHAFLVATESFPGFGTTGDLAERKREVAAFLAQVSRATSGLCHINSTVTENDFCTSSQWPCASGKKYSPRGAIQLAHNSNYGLAGQALGLDLIENPELVEKDPIVSFKTAIWFWMTKHNNKPLSEFARIRMAVA